MAGGSSSGRGSPGKKTGKVRKANKQHQSSNGSKTNTASSLSGNNMVNTEINQSAKLLPLAPPAAASQHQWTVRNPISLIFEIFLIFYMFFITLYLKMFRAILPKSKKSVHGKVVLITGSGRGLGRELAVQFAKLGAIVACVDVDQVSNEETAQMVQAEVPGATVKAYTVNVAASAEITALAVKVELDLGPVDVLVNNAAVIIGHTFLGAQDHTIASVININLLGHFWMIRTFLPSMMKRNSGHIVAISSTSALSGLPKLSAYTASKWGVNGMMESLREELREHPHNKIQTTIVEPDLVNTSADYMKYISTRVPALSVERAAKSAVDGILLEKVEFTIPFTVYYTSMFRRILPVNISDSIKNIFYVKVMLPSQESQENLPNMAIINRTPAAN